MRQVGDRLIPIGITSGRVVAAEGVEGAGEGVESGGGSSRRRRRHQQNADINQLLGTVGLGPLAGQDLEEVGNVLEFCYLTCDFNPPASVTAYGYGSNAIIPSRP